MKTYVSSGFGKEVAALSRYMRFSTISVLARRQAILSCELDRGQNDRDRGSRGFSGDQESGVRSQESGMRSQEPGTAQALKS